MAIRTENKNGAIVISNNVIANAAGIIATSCYGVVGMTSQKPLKDGFNELLKRENYSKGVVIKNIDGGIEVDLYCVIGYGVKITEVINEIQKRVKYTLEKSLDIDVLAVNVYVQGIKVVG